MKEEEWRSVFVRAQWEMCLLNVALIMKIEKAAIIIPVLILFKFPAVS